MDWGKRVEVKDGKDVNGGWDGFVAEEVGVDKP